MKLKPRDKRSLLKAALGEIPCDTVVTNVTVFNVFTGELLPADVYIYDGFVAHVEYDTPGVITGENKEVIDGNGAIMTPGFIDAHVHIESSMLTPRNFAKVIIPHGTTTIITDPHEIGNVYGVRGVQYMHDIASDLPMRQFIDIPSCVPAVPGLEIAGAEFGAAEVHELAKLERVIGLAEVMDYIGVMNGDERMMSIIEAAEEHGLYLQAHSPTVKGRQLSAYLCGGPHSDHESGRSGEPLHKIRQGMYIDLRESSLSHNAVVTWEDLKDIKFYDRMCLCTDDVESSDVIHNGNINHTIRVAHSAGMDILLGIKSCTINAATAAHIENLGAIAPGFVADFNLFEDLEGLEPKSVYYMGKKVAEDGKMVVEIEDRHAPIESENSINFGELTEESFGLVPPIENGTLKINVMTYEDETQSTTFLTQREVQVKDGKIIMDDPNLNYITIVNRYGAGTIGTGFVYRHGLKRGCLGTTVAHDSHNLNLIYHDPKDALAAAHEIKRVGGGLTAVENGEVLATLPLPIAGLLTPKTAEEFEPEVDALKDADRHLGITEVPNPLLRCAILALVVSPHIRMSDLGMVDVDTQTFINPFA